jgi:ketosteroid isomerase-like protein
MADHPNAARIKQLFAAFANRDMQTAKDVISEDAVWHFPGTRGRLAGDHSGREGILRFLASVMTLTQGTFHLDLQDVIASDDTAIALFTGHGERAGKTLHNPTCLRMQIRDGKIAELWEFVWDLEHVEEFWA